MLYVLIGFLLSGVGTLVGVGGGFLLVPILFFLHPEMSAAKITSISLFCVALNAISGSIQYSRLKLIHFQSGLLLALFSIPGAWLGVDFTHKFTRDQFEIVYAGLLIAISFYMFLKSQKPIEIGNSKFVVSRFNYMIGAAGSVITGGLASFFGVGGGIMNVPLLQTVLKMPMHIAVGTSVFILAATSIVGSINHYQSGTLTFAEPYIFYLSVGMVVGAQVAARYSRAVSAKHLMRILAVIILLVALRIFILKMTS